MSNKLLFVKRKDIFVILGLLIVSFIAWKLLTAGSRNKDDCHAEIYYDGNLAVTAYLDKPRVFSIDGLPQVVFEVKEGTIAFIHSDCPDQICVRAGRLESPGQFAACLPNKVTLFMTGGQDVDAVDITVR